MLNELTDFIFPKTSLISDERIQENNSNRYILDEEIDLLPIVSNEDLQDFKDKVKADNVFSFFCFREGDDFSKLIYQLKYGGMKKLGIFLGNIAGNKLKERLNEEASLEFDLIISVPLFKTKLRERGYNQSEFICKGINEHLRIEFLPDLVKRVRHTSTQTKLNKEQRINNLYKAFELNSRYTDMISGKRIIVVDDVVTTGSTMNEVIRVLRKNNCAEVMACALAMAR